MTGYDAYCLYQALKLHFSLGKYDFFKYHGKTKVSVAHFEQRNDRYFFHKLARKFPDSDKLTFFLAANFFGAKAQWVRDLFTEEANDVYLEKLKIKESLEYTVKEDLNKLLSEELTIARFRHVLKVTDGEYPLLLTSAVHGGIRWETIIVLNAVIGFLPLWGQKITDTILFPDLRMKCERYQPFLNVDVKKFQTLLKSLLTKNTK